MLCCTDFFGSDTTTNSDNDYVASFPGHSPCDSSTGENASREYNPAETVTSSSRTGILLVQVPAGSKNRAGETMRVKVPGEDRIMVVKVPPGGVTEFYVPYELNPHTNSENLFPQSQNTENQITDANSNDVVHSGNNSNSNPQNDNGVGVVSSIV